MDNSLEIMKYSNLAKVSLPEGQTVMHTLREFLKP